MVLQHKAFNLRASQYIASLKQAECQWFADAPSESS